MEDSFENSDWEKLIAEVADEYGKWYSITEASEKLKLNAGTMRKYEDDFGLFITRDEKDHRKYSSNDIAIFAKIMIMKSSGFTMPMIKTALTRSVDVMEQKETNLQLVPIDKLTAGEFNDYILKSFVSVMESREEGLKNHYTQEVDGLKLQIDALTNQIENMNEQNTKALNDITRMLEKKSEGFFSNIFKKK